MTGQIPATLRLGTRRSALAMAQARSVAEAITARAGRSVELVEVTTYGDVSREALAQIGGTGVFVNAIREWLLDGRIDLAVHSLKDLPTKEPEGLVLAAVPQREDPRDALVARDGLTLAELPSGSRVGTGSPRRAAQLEMLGYGLQVVPIRGNVDTRMRMVTDGELDAVVLARAGLARLGKLDVMTEPLDPAQMLPAPGQGALAVECTSDPASAALVNMLSGLDDAPTRAAVTAERALLATLEAGCSAPVGALAESAEGEEFPELYLRAVVGGGVPASSAGPGDGTARSVRMSATGPLGDAELLGQRLAAEMLAEGAAGLIGERVP
ncbi:MAG: hydroxymethylbilane synthase [Carbonactinosporaceae bacterium]